MGIGYRQRSERPKPASRLPWALGVDCAVVLFILLGPVSASAQYIGLGNFSGSIAGTLNYSRQETKTGRTQSVENDLTRTTEEVSIRNSNAYLLDPRVLIFSLGGTFGLNQEHETRGTRSASRDSRLQGFEFIAEALPGQDVSLNVFANRQESVLFRELAGRSDILTENQGGTLFIRRLRIPSVLSFRREVREEDTETGGIRTFLESRRNVFNYSGARDWQDGEIQLRYEYDDFDDLTKPDLSFRNQDGTLDYSLIFGRDIDIRWDTRVHGLDRTGSSPLRIWEVNEFVRVDHSADLRTDYRYFFQKTSVPFGTRVTHRGDIGLHHELYQSLSTNLGLFTDFQNFPGGDRENYRGDLSFGYRKSLPGNGVLNATLGGALGYQREVFDNSVVFVTQESHTAATPFAVPLALDNPFVVIASVVVTKIAVGPLPAGCVPPTGPPTPLVLGRDYSLQTAGDVTEIVPIPCAGLNPGLNPGDTIAVDYQFTVVSSQSFTTQIWRASLSVNYGWIRPYLLHEETNQTLRSGRSSEFLDDQRSDTAGVELRFEGVVYRINVIVEAKRFKSRRQAYDSIRSNQIFSFDILPRINLTIQSSQARFEFTRPRDQERVTLDGSATLRYAYNSSFFADVFVTARRLDDSLVQDEVTASAGLTIRWFFRKIEVSNTLEYFKRKQGNTDSDEFRALLRIVRRF